MNAALYKRIRIVIAALTLGVCTLAFADIGNWLPAAAARVALWPQFVPSLLSLGGGLSWLAAGAILVIALTLVFGRIYCAMLCPLGVLMDLSAWLARRTGRKRRLPFRPTKPWPRVLPVAVCGIGLLAGSALPLAMLDPYSVFGKIVSSLLRPPLAWLNHAVSATGLMQPVTVSPVSWITAGVALGFLLLVVLSAVFKGRIWCNTVCPVGALLGFLSKRALYRLRISDEACIGCSMCERVCPSQCVDFKHRRIDHSRCVMCMDCVTSCKRSGISLGRKSQQGRDLSPKGPGDVVRDERTPCESNVTSCTGPFGERSLPSNSRRMFIISAVAIPAAAMAEERGRHRKGNHGSDCNCAPSRKQPVLPPGARSLAHFQSRCTACQLCVANCPEQILRPSITQHGLAGFLQPYQDFEVGFCSYNCSDCSQICPTGAIQPVSVEERRTVRTGKAEFFRGRCVVKTHGTSCGACNEHCPTQAVHMVPWENGLTIPEVDPELCIGCGGCEFICPVRPERAIIVSGLKVHERAKAVVLGRKNTVRKMEQEFPF